MHLRHDPGPPQPTTDLDPKDGDFPLPEVPVAFHVHDETTANWVIRKITEARQYAAKVKAWADLEAHRAEREEDFFLRRFGGDLEAWAASSITNGRTRKKSISLPSGTLGFRRCEPKLVIDDEEAVIEWAKRSCPTAVRTVLKLAKTPLNEHFAATGEIPSKGAHIEPAQERFYVR